MSCIQTRGLAYSQISYRDLDIEEGKATFISGPSGCGKSTLLRLFNKMLAPTAGAVLYQGQDMADIDSIVLRREVLLAGQSVFLFEGTVGENFDAFCEARESANLAAEDKLKFLRLCCANFPLDAPCVHLSGGERQRLFIVLALIPDPQLVFLDELTTGLDAKARRDVWKILEELKSKGLTIFLTSHFMDEVEALCDEICILKNGRAVFYGTVAQAKEQCGCEKFEDAYLMLSGEEGMDK